jgi:hypothetical protein
MRTSPPPRQHRDHHCILNGSTRRTSTHGPSTLEQQQATSAQTAAPPNTSTTTGTNGGTRNASPPRRLRRQGAAVTCPDGWGLHPIIPHDKNIVPRSDAPSREINAQKASPSCPLTPIAPCLSPAHAHGSSRHPTSSAPPSPGEALCIPSTTTTPERTTAKHPTPPPW